MLVNLTPHVLNIHLEDGTVLEVAPSGIVARVATIPHPAEPVVAQGISIPCVQTSFGEVVGLPDPDPETTFVVSGMVLEALRGGRPDVVAPGDLVRDPQGRPCGCRGLRRG